MSFDLKISDLYQNISRDSAITLTEDDLPVNITSDTVTMTIKKRLNDPDVSSFLIKNADVTTEGVTGRAIFRLTIPDTSFPVGEYYLDIIWLRSTGIKKVAHTQVIRMLDRGSDV